MLAQPSKSVYVELDAANLLAVGRQSNRDLSPSVGRASVEAAVQASCGTLNSSQRAERARLGVVPVQRLNAR